MSNHYGAKLSIVSDEGKHGWDKKVNTKHFMHSPHAAGIGMC